MNKKHNYFLVICIIFFLIFGVLYFTEVTDLYQYKQYNKMTITKEAMKRFESDIESGKDITISDYLDNVKDYSNGLSKLGYNTSKTVTEIMNKGLKKTFKVLASLFT